MVCTTWHQQHGGVTSCEALWVHVRLPRSDNHSAPISETYVCHRPAQCSSPQELDAFGLGKSCWYFDSLSLIIYKHVYDNGGWIMSDSCQTIGKTPPIPINQTHKVLCGILKWGVQNAIFHDSRRDTSSNLPRFSMWKKNGCNQI